MSRGAGSEAIRAGAAGGDGTLHSRAAAAVPRPHEVDVCPFPSILKGLDCSSALQRHWRLGIWGKSMVQWVPGLALGWHCLPGPGITLLGRVQRCICMRAQ